MKSFFSYAVVAVLAFAVGTFFAPSNNDSRVVDNTGSALEQTQVENEQDRKIAGETSVGLDLAESQIFWEASKFAGGDHDGEVGLKGGSVTLSGEQVVGGSFVVDMESISNADLEGEESEKLLTHLKSEDFFETAVFPEASFEVRSITTLSDSGDANYEVAGDLTIKGVTNSVVFPALISRTEDGRVAANAEFEIERSRWGLRWGDDKFLDNLGDRIISEEIVFALELVTLPL